MSNTKRRRPGTNITIKGQVTLPKAVREAAGMRPGDRVVPRALPNGTVIIEPAQPTRTNLSYRGGLEDLARQRPFRGFTTDELMKMTRGED